MPDATVNQHPAGVGERLNGEKMIIPILLKTRLRMGGELGSHNRKVIRAYERSIIATTLEKAVKSVICAAGLAAGLGLSGHAEAAESFLTGNELLSHCASKDSSRELCLGYAVAVADIMFSGMAINGFRACAAEGMTSVQISDVLLKYLDGHPEERHLAAHSLVSKALAEAFPCRPRGTVD